MIRRACVYETPSLIIRTETTEKQPETRRSDPPCRSAFVLLIGFLAPAEQAQGCGGYVLSGEAEIAQNYIARRRCAVVVDSDGGAFVGGVLVPTLAHSGFNGDAEPHTLRQNTFAVSLILRLEEIPAWHAHHAGLYSVAREFLLRFHAEGDLRARA